MIAHHSGIVRKGVVVQIIVVGTIRDILIQGSLKLWDMILCMAAYPQVGQDIQDFFLSGRHPHVLKAGQSRVHL